MPSLRDLLTRNLGLKATSLLLAVLLWVVASGEETVRARLPVEVLVQAPPGRVVTNEIPAATATVVGPRRELIRLAASRLVVLRTLPADGASRLDLDLAPADVVLPEGTRALVQDVQPRYVRVALGRAR